MWCDELSKKIIKDVTVEFNNKPVHCLNSEAKVVTNHINKKDMSENNYFDVEEKDIKLVMDKTDLSRKTAIEELQKNDIVTVLMNYMKLSD
jgi:NACalpha-BTF3-like transcription factor